MNIQIIQSFCDGILMGGVYALAALGLSLIFGVMKITNFAHGALMTMGMYMIYQISVSFGISPYLALPFSVVIMFAAGYVIQRYLIQPASKVNPQNQLLVTLGISIIIENLLLVIFTPDYKSVSVKGFEQALFVGDLSFNKPKLIAFCVVILITVAIYLVLYKTYIGKAVRAASMNTDGAQLSGVVIKKINAVAFGIGALCTGIAGALLTPVIYINPTIGSTFQLKCFVIAVLGGMGNIFGALVSGIIIGVVESVCGFVLGGSWSEMIIYIIFVLILLFKPNGIFARRGDR